MREIYHPYTFKNGEKIERNPRIEIATPPVFLNADLSGQKFLYDGEEYEISLLGRHQLSNASLAICAVKELRKKHWLIDESAVKSGLKNAVWHARFEIVKNAEQMFNLVVPSRKTLVFDGSHNPHGAKTLANGIAEFFKDKRVSLVLGILHDKDFEGVVEVLLPYANEVVCVTPPSPRALDKNELKIVVGNVAQKMNKQIEIKVEDTIKSAVQNALCGDCDVVVLCGSLTLFSAL